MLFHKNKKGLNPITFLFMSLLVVALIFIITIFLLQSKDIIIDHDKKEAQLIILQLTNKNCFSDNIMEIKAENLNQENLDLCLKSSTENLVRININEETFYLESKEEEFNQKADFCNLLTSCYEKKLPIIFEENDFKNKKIITIQIISN